MSVHIGVNGAVRDVNALHVGVNGAVHEVQAGYCGVNGVVRQFYSKVNTTLANNSWATIAQVAASGQAAQYWKVGDEINITLTTGEVLTLVIMGFNHDDKADGTGKAGITFGTKQVLAEHRQMNAANTNVTAFTDTTLYKWLLDTLFEQLPSGLQSVIKSVNKKTSAGNKSTTIKTDSVSIFTFSEIEVFGSTTYSVAGEGTQYPYFATAANRIKARTDDASYLTIWWERSPQAAFNNGYCCVDADGTASIGLSTNYFSVCFGFCV